MVGWEVDGEKPLEDPNSTLSLFILQLDSTPHSPKWHQHYNLILWPISMSLVLVIGLVWPMDMVFLFYSVVACYAYLSGASFSNSRDLCYPLLSNVSLVAPSDSDGFQTSQVITFGLV